MVVNKGTILSVQEVHNGVMVSIVPSQQEAAEVC